MDLEETSAPIKVAVRVRPFSKSDINDGAKSAISIDHGQKCITITNPKKDGKKVFYYDYIYDSCVDPRDPSHANQETLWNDLGAELISAAWDGYNYSLFAYGQTGSGKSYSMLGFGEKVENRGILPRACESIFTKISEYQSNSGTEDMEDISFKVEASMMEIYNEKIRDLFVPLQQQQHGGLRVRDSPKTGQYVEGLKKVPVSTSEQIKSLIDLGTRNRTVAATNMNETSSRAHTIFTISIVKTVVDRQTMKASNKTSLISLVDLAGSERIGKTGAEGDRLKEGGHINKSLSALGNVINALAENAKGRKQVHVPYRNSVLTHLLKSSLGGNSKTTMIAAISPTDTNFPESLSTLRYADRTKQIKNTATVNEDPNDRLIRHLREEMERMRRQLESNSSVESIKAEMAAAFRIELEQKQAEWEQHQREAETALILEGSADNRGNMAGMPYLSNLNEDDALTGKLLYDLKPGESRTITSVNDSVRKQLACDDRDRLILLGGMGIVPNHAKIEHQKTGASSYLTLSAVASGTRTMVNGIQACQEKEMNLYHNDRLIFGHNCVFRVVLPDDMDTNKDVQIDWEFSQKEANIKIMRGLEEEDEEHIAAVERIKHEMQNKVQELEEMLTAERKRNVEVGPSKEGVLQKQRELEKRLSQQMLENEKFTQQQEQERKERNMIDRRLLHTLPLVHEANSIGCSLQKIPSFKVKLLSRANDEYLVNGRLPQEVEYTTEIVVLCKISESHQNLWSLDKFNSRVYLMREMYQAWMHNGGSLKGTDFQSSVSDPFYDPPENQLLGVARIQLEALRYLLDIQEHTPIVNHSGRSQGELEVIMIPSILDFKTDSVEDLEEVIGKHFGVAIQVKSARGLSSEAVATFKSFFVRWRMLSPDWTKSKNVVLNSINPIVYHQTQVQATITEELCNFFSSCALCLEVWASVDEPSSEVPETNIASRAPDGREFLLYENMKLKKQNEELSTKLSCAVQRIRVLEEAMKACKEGTKTSINEL